MSSTKAKILTAALKLFNQDGFVNVRLQHIADEAFISVGNLAYHYHNKEAILLALYKDLVQKQKDLLAEYRIVPLFDNINRLLVHTFQLQEAFLFFYLDTLELIRANPSIGRVHRQHIDWQIGQLKNMLEFNVSRGALRPELVNEAIKNLASQMWMTIDLWRTQQLIRGEVGMDEADFCTAVWALYIPYFTEMGRLEYKQMLQSPYDFYF